MSRTIACVFPHPDDETTIGPLLAKLASDGHHIIVVCVTSGQAGVTRNTTLKAGAELGEAREQEMRRSCAELGLEPPVLLQYPDGAISHTKVLANIATDLLELFRRLEPDIVITFGPDGASGHADHRSLAAVTTEVFQSSGFSAPPQKLYYVAYPASLFAKFDSKNQELMFLHRALLSRPIEDCFITTVVDCHPFLDQADAAIRCHRTQWAPALMDAWSMLNREILQGRVYLRLAMTRMKCDVPESAIVW